MTSLFYQRLHRLVKQRGRSYHKAKHSNGWGKAEKLKAVGTVLRKLNFYIDKPKLVQAKVVLQLQDQLLLILPAESSRFTNVRADMLAIIEECRDLVRQANTQQRLSEFDHYLRSHNY